MYFDAFVYTDISLAYEILGIHTSSNTKKSAINKKDPKTATVKY